MDAAARPFPSDDTTPPVTKMYLVVRRSVMMLPGPDRAGHDPCVKAGLAANSRPASTWRRRRQQTAHVFEILRRVDAERFVSCFHGLDPNAVLQGAQLLEGLGPF